MKTVFLTPLAAAAALLIGTAASAQEITPDSLAGR